MHDIAPERAVMTLSDAGGLDLEDVVGTFCRYVHSLASEEAARAWTERNEATYVASIPEAFEYERLHNYGQFGTALEHQPSERSVG